MYGPTRSQIVLTGGETSGAGPQPSVTKITTSGRSLCFRRASKAGRKSVPPPPLTSESSCWADRTFFKEWTSQSQAQKSMSAPTAFSIPEASTSSLGRSARYSAGPHTSDTDVCEVCSGSAFVGGWVPTDVEPPGDMPAPPQAKKVTTLTRETTTDARSWVTDLNGCFTERAPKENPSTPLPTPPRSQSPSRQYNSHTM